MIGISSFKMVNQFEDLSKFKIYGSWEYEKIIIDGKEFDASNLNECGYKDVLEIRKNKEVVEYEFDGKEIKGDRIGISNSKICSIDPIDYKYVVVSNSCETQWVRLRSNQKRIVSIADGIMIEYEIEIQNRRTMLLSKKKEITNYGSKVPDKIILKKRKKGN